MEFTHFSGHYPNFRFNSRFNPTVKNHEKQGKEKR